MDLRYIDPQARFFLGFFLLRRHTASESSTADWFLVFGLLCGHTASKPITTEMHTSGAQ